MGWYAAAGGGSGAMELTRRERGEVVRLEGLPARPAQCFVLFSSKPGCRRPSY